MRTLYIAGAYFTFLLVLALWVRDVPYDYNVFTLTAPELVQTSALGDPSSFATAAMDVAQNGWISVENEWIFNLWPPGFVVLEALIIRVLGPEVPIILALQVLATVLFSVVLTLLCRHLDATFGKTLAFLLPLAIFAFPVSRVFLLQPTGVTLGETFAIGFFLIGLLLTLRSAETGRMLNAVLAGSCIALSAYFRSQFEIILLALTFWGLITMTVLGIRRLTVERKSRRTKTVLLTIGVTILVAHVTTAPWRAYHWMNHETLKWVQTSTLTFRNSVLESKELEELGAGWVVAGGGNLTCQIDPTTCGRLENAESLFVRTFLSNPFEWYARKSEIIGDYWFAPVQNWTAVSVGPTVWDFVNNTLILAALGGLVVLLCLRNVRAWAEWYVQVWFTASLLSAYALIITVSQFEVRYFYFPKIVILAMFIIAARFVVHRHRPPSDPLA